MFDKLCVAAFIVGGGCVEAVLCNAGLSVISSFATILLRTRELVALQHLLLKVPWVCLWSVIVTYPSHSNLFCLLYICCSFCIF